MANFERVVALIVKNGDRIAQATTAIMMLIIVFNSIGRIMDYPIYGTEDYVSLLSIILVSFTIAYCAMQERHIKIDLVVSRFPPRIQGIIGSITNILSLGLFLIVSWQCVVLAMRMMQTGDRSMSASIILYPFLFVVAFGCLLLSLVIMVDLGKSLTKAVKS